MISVNYGSYAQFHPAAGISGTNAIHKDSSVFIDWVRSATIVRGYQNCSNTSAGYTSAGDSSMVTLQAGSNGVVSLGDGGMATCIFNATVSNGPGYDFAVFENSFSDNFLELAFVEVSSDGFTFIRFPATCLIQDTVQTGPFDTTGIPEKINNLAGKYRALYGTPFDLEELIGTPGLNVNNITHIRVIDAVGSINEMYATFDQYGNKINEPWPTEFPTGGFDLDAIGVINNHINTVHERDDLSFSLYPNPVTDFLQLQGINSDFNFSIADISGRILSQGNNQTSIPMSAFLKGFYFITIRANGIVKTITVEKN